MTGTQRKRLAGIADALERVDDRLDKFHRQLPDTEPGRMPTQEVGEVADAHYYLGMARECLDSALGKATR